MIAFLILQILMSSQILSQPIPLEARQFVSIGFDHIPETKYHFSNGILEARAEQSASFLIHSFEHVQKVSEISFEWYGEGLLAVQDSKHEASKAGDDAWLRIGLLLHGPAPSIPFLAPSWIKQTRRLLSHPANRLLYLVVGTKHKLGSRWNSPYAKSIANIAVSSEASATNPWRKARQRFEKPIELVGLWLMVDSDNSKSKIVTRVRNLQLN